MSYKYAKSLIISQYTNKRALKVHRRNYSLDSELTTANRSSKQTVRWRSSVGHLQPGHDSLVLVSARQTDRQTSTNVGLSPVELPRSHKNSWRQSQGLQPALVSSVFTRPSSLLCVVVWTTCSSYVYSVLLRHYCCYNWCTSVVVILWMLIASLALQSRMFA